MNTVKERIVAEIVRRLESQEFSTINFDKVIRSEIPEDYSGEQGSLLAVLETREEYRVNANKTDVEFGMVLDFAVPLADGEQSATVVNNTTGDIIRAFNDAGQLEEGGAGTGGEKLISGMWADMSEHSPYYETEHARGIVQFRGVYRTRHRDPFQRG